MLEDIQLRVQRLPAVQVLAIAAAPSEAAPVHDLEASGVDTVGAQQLQVLLREVGADHRHQTHGGEEPRCEREVRCRSAERVVHLAERRADVVQGDRADEQNGIVGHALLQGTHEAPTSSAVLRWT